ncbi:MAG: hypothetical protein WBF47_13730, partial [Xanthobacteraceae bacterium]
RGEAGLSDAGLAGQEHHAAFAVLICCQRRISRSISSSRPTSGAQSYRAAMTRRKARNTAGQE